MKILIYISSLTGNTRKVGLHAAEKLRGLGHNVIIENTHETLSVIRRLQDEAEKSSSLPSATPAAISSVLHSADLILVCFWCRRGSMDDDSLRLLSLYEGQRIAVLGTMGGDPARPYGERVRHNALAAVSEQNIPAGVFVCQGKIQESRTEKRRNLPKNHVHYLDDESYARHLASRSHPDEKDLEEAWAAVQGWL